MTHIEQIRTTDRPVRTVERDGRMEYVVDLGDEARGATVDVVDGTAIVVTGDEQREIDVPGPDPQAFIRNGVLTIATEETA